jgi:hypothetical protein
MVAKAPLFFADHGKGWIAPLPNPTLVADTGVNIVPAATK